MLPCVLVAACSGKLPWAAGSGDGDAGPEAGPAAMAARDRSSAAPAVDFYGQALPGGAIARLGTVELRHHATQLAWSPDSKLIGRQDRTRMGDPDRQAEVALSPSGDLVAASGSDGGIHVWKATAEQGAAPIMSFAGHDGAITALVFTPDCKLLLSGSADTTILVWDVSAGHP